MNFFGRNSQININGKTYVGNNITVNNGRVYIDGKLQDGEEEHKMTITVLCNVDKIVSTESINILGSVTGNVEANVNVNCDNIKGNVNAGANINCDDITGDAHATAIINCDDISGNATANIINK